MPVSTKLKKQSNSAWLCMVNGRIQASWVMADADHVKIVEYGSGWNAINTTTDSVILRAIPTRSLCAEMMADKLNSTEEQS
jgi:hypothetical protein